MTTKKTIHCRGTTEPILETISVRGRRYYCLEKLSRRGAFRVFDPTAGPGGDYRVLYRFPRSQITTRNREVLRRLSGQTANRNFPGIVDFVYKKNEFFVVVEWVTGSNLRDYVKAVRSDETPRPSIAEVVRLFRGLAHGVAHYHRRTQLVHGDISPANIIVTSPARQLVLIDFGSAWPIEDTTEKDKGDGATLPYASPERLDGSQVIDFRSDAFSLAVVAYELITLEVPYDGLGGRAGLPQVAKVAAKSYKPPSKLNRQAERLTRSAIAQLDSCFQQSLALARESRYKTVSDWLTDWDRLNSQCQKGTQLTPLESAIVNLLDTIAGLLGRKKN
ncbi:MAG: protein kinase [Planctomycetota bacterium]